MSTFGWTVSNYAQSQKNYIARHEAENAQKRSEARLLKMFADALSPLVIKYILQMIKDDLNAPETMRIFSGPTKSLSKVVEEVIETAQSVEFKNALKNKIRLGTFGIALAVDLDTPIEDALHDDDFYSIVTEEVEQFLSSSRLQRILESPSLDVTTKLKQIEPILNNKVSEIVTRLRNGCYSDFPLNPSVCRRAQNVAREAGFAHKAHNIATQKMRSLGQKVGVNLSSVSAFNVAKMFFKGGKQTRKTKKSHRRKQTRRRR